MILIRGNYFVVKLSAPADGRVRPKWVRQGRIYHAQSAWDGDGRAEVSNSQPLKSTESLWFLVSAWASEQNTGLIEAGVRCVVFRGLWKYYERIGVVISRLLNAWYAKDRKVLGVTPPKSCFFWCKNIARRSDSSRKNYTINVEERENKIFFICKPTSFSV